MVRPLVCTAILVCPALSDTPSWMRVDEGLEWAVIDAPVKSLIGDSKITVVRIDPDFYDLTLVTAAGRGGTRHTAREWCEKDSLIACVNAGMFQMDGLTSVGYMKSNGQINNGKLNDYRSLLLFQPEDAGLPSVRFADSECDEFAPLISQYRSAVQNLRVIACSRRNVWSKQERRWSMVLLAVDGAGRILFIHTRLPYSVHDFADILLMLPLDIRRAMYLEGGPEASLYLSAGKTRLERFGSYETGFNENDQNSAFWPIPNVIGATPRKK